MKKNKKLKKKIKKLKKFKKSIFCIMKNCKVVDTGTSYSSNFEVSFDVSPEDSKIDEKFKSFLYKNCLM